jgi:LuxR family maltose regulon positive regulatory protein
VTSVGVVESPGTPATQSDATRWFGPSFLLEESKLRPPSPRPGTVRRTALLDRLRTSPDLPVVSIVAPPGYGKSALLSQWAEETPRRVAWVSLEAEDNDPAVLMAYIAAALDRAQPIDADILRTRAPPGMSVAATVARRIAATMSGMVDPVALVLDHTELLYNHQCRDAIAELALHIPPIGKLVLASRGLPPVPTASLRARGAVVEIGADDLAMDESEARLLLEGAGVELADTELAALVRHTEGWPVGLYLGALASKADGRRPAAGLAFSGDDRLMADYLRTELLSRVPRGGVSFLTRTSVLERMCGPLCDAVVDGTPSGRLLEALEGSNLLLVPLDRTREWYRYHKLFQQLLRAELGQREAGAVTQLHSRAAWYESNGLPEMAITHAQAAGDADQVARLVTACMLAAYAGGRLETVDRWFQWFDDHDLIENYPSVAVLGAVFAGGHGSAGGGRALGGCGRTGVGGNGAPGRQLARELAGAVAGLSVSPGRGPDASGRPDGTRRPCRRKPVACVGAGAGGGLLAARRRARACRSDPGAGGRGRAGHRGLAGGRGRAGRARRHRDRARRVG